MRVQDYNDYKKAVSALKIILELDWRGSLSFVEIQRSTKESSATVSVHLLDLQRKGLTTKVVDKFILTDTGRASIPATKKEILQKYGRYLPKTDGARLPEIVHFCSESVTVHVRLWGHSMLDLTEDERSWLNLNSRFFPLENRNDIHIRKITGLSTIKSSDLILAGF